MHNNTNYFIYICTLLDFVGLYRINEMVEAAGIEPASRKEDFEEPTCLVSVLSLRQEDTR